MRFILKLLEKRIWYEKTKKEGKELGSDDYQPIETFTPGLKILEAEL